MSGGATDAGLVTRGLLGTFTGATQWGNSAVSTKRRSDPIRICTDERETRPMTATSHRVLPTESSTFAYVAPDRPVDPTLAAVLLAKPSNDAVPQAVWWYLAESLQHSVTVRRGVQGVETLTAAEIRQQASRARLYAEAALEAVGLVAAGDNRWRRPDLPSNATLRVTMSALASLLVTSRAVTAVQLRATLLAHLRALDVATQRVPTAPNRLRGQCSHESIGKRANHTSDCSEHAHRGARRVRSM